MPQLSISEKVPACLKVESVFSNGEFKGLENDHRVLKIANNCAQNILVEKIEFFPALVEAVLPIPPFDISFRRQDGKYLLLKHNSNADECGIPITSETVKEPICGKLVIAPKHEIGIPINWGNFYRVTGKALDEPIEIEAAYVVIHDKDFVNSVNFFLTEANNGSMLAQRILGNAYLQVDKIKSYAEAKKWLLSAAEKGDPESQAALGYAYLGFPKYKEDVVRQPEYTEAAKWLQKAVDQNIDYAACPLGDLYAEGRGVKKDFALALKLWAGKDRQLIDTLRSKAARGDIRAQIKLGDIYFYTTCNPSDEIQDESFKWYLQAAQAGSAEAQLTVALKYRDSADQEARFEMMKNVREAKNGDEIARLPDSRFSPEMMQWLQKSVDQNYPPAQAVLAGFYQFGIAIDKDTDKALLLFKKSAEQGYYEAQDILAELALEKQPPDYEEAYFQALLASRADWSRSDKEAIKKNLTTAQIAEIEKRAEAWKPTPIYIPKDGQKK